MVDTSTLSEQGLRDDLAETIGDIVLCEHALDIGVEEYSGGPVVERLEVNQRIKVAIDSELARRMGKLEVFGEVPDESVA